MVRKRRRNTTQSRRRHAWARVFFIVIAVAALALVCLWRTPIGRATRMAWQLQRMEAPTGLLVPVQGVQARHIADTWGGPRSGGRRHEGVDIFAPRGTHVRSATMGVVISVREGGLGGRQVWVLGPGAERHYYAHLDDWAPGLARYQIVRAGTPLGVVGDTGNAKGTPPHLHYGIYRVGGAYNPWPLLQRGAAVSPPR